MNMLKKFFVEEEGVNLTEYAMLLALIAIAAVVAVEALGNGISDLFISMNTEIDSWTQ